MAVSSVARVGGGEPHYSRTAMNTVEIRPERAADVAAIRTVHTEAFGRPDDAGLVDRLRERAHPYVGLVAADGGEIVGHIELTPGALRGRRGVVLYSADF